MKILRHCDLDPGGLAPQFERVSALLEAGNFRGADVKKLAPGPYYRAKLSDADRLIFRFGAYRGEQVLILLEIIRNHAYAASRFLRGAAVDESKLTPVVSPAPLAPDDIAALNYVNPVVPRVHLLDKILSFDDLQESARLQRPPLILIGSAGSGKTVLTLEKLRQLPGEILYVTHSPFLVDNARALYYAHHYENENQEVTFLSFLEYVQSIEAPSGAPLSFNEFAAWFGSLHRAGPICDAHPVFEEINGVLTGSAVTKPHLSRDEYLSLGVRRSIFAGEDRPALYDLFRRYLAFLPTSGRFDLNLVCHALHATCKQAYDFVVADEVQDLTAVQLSLILQSLRQPDQFVLCGDSNQIVHPNFFSWAAVKSYFYEQRLRGRGEIIRVLNTNYRNSPQITDLANRLLLIKNARFGSIDRESHYLVNPVSENAGVIEFLPDSQAVRREIDAKTGRSTRFAVLVMRPEDKAEAQRTFRTPLVFSVQEAKGLEYDNIILLNFVSLNPREFAELVDGVSADDLGAAFTYARAGDKGDKSLEAYKFYVNALYVAVTRAVRNLYILEHDPSHPLLSLLRLELSRDAAGLAEQESSSDEWKAEAHRLERQGKAEQAEAIRRTILRTTPVPWPVLAPGSLHEIRRKALDTVTVDPKARHLLLDYAATYSDTPLIHALAQIGFRPALRPDDARRVAQQRHEIDYHQRGFRDLHRKIDQHGVDFRNPLNQTPLMVATQLGLVPLVQELIRDGASVHLRDSWGRVPLQLALRAAFADFAYAERTLGALYPLLAPDALIVFVGGRLIKIDNHRMEFFLLHAMLARFEFVLRHKIHDDAPAFETGDFVHALQYFPESVIPTRRRTRQAITAALAGNEVLREAPYNRGLFLRVARGLYIINPCLEVEQEGVRTNVCDLLHFAALAQDAPDSRLAHFLKFVADRRRELEAGARVTASTKATTPAPATPAPVAATRSEPIRVSADAAAPPLPRDEDPYTTMLNLHQVDDIFPTYALRRMIGHPEAYADRLLKTLEDTIAQAPVVARSPVRAHLYAMFLLAQFRDARACPLIARLAALPEADALLGDTLTESLDRLLASTCGGDPAPIEQLIRNRTASEWARAAGVRALVILVLHADLDRDAVIRVLGRLMDDPDSGLEREPSVVWAAAVDAAYALQPIKLVPAVERAFRDELVEGGVVEFKDLVDQARLPIASVLSTSRRSVKGLVEDTIAEMSWWACFRQPRRRGRRQNPIQKLRERLRLDQLPSNQSPSPAAAADEWLSPPDDEAEVPIRDEAPLTVAPKPGRNAPCSCGSGKKYKKCCGR